MTEHARFSPSSAERWMTCPGSIAATQGVEDPSSRFADEGTIAHTLAARALTYNKPADFYLGEEIQHGNLVLTVDEEMAGHIQVYLDHINELIGDGTLMHEQKVEFSQAIGVAEQFGTADAIILSADGKRVIIRDLKYGMGVKVFAEENRQFMLYALGVLETYGAVMEDVEEIDMGVVQPRIDHIDSWVCPVGRLREFATEAQLAAQAALEGCVQKDITGKIPDELFRPSEDGCRWCPIKANCHALQRHVSALVFDDFDVLDDPASLEVIGAPAVPAGAERLGALFGALDLIEGWCRGVRAEVERMVMAGMDIIGPDGQRMKVIEGKKGHRSWADEEQAEAVLAGLLPADKLYQPKRIVKVPDAEKLLGGKKKAGKQQWDDMIRPLIAQSPGKPHVALGSHPAPPYTPQAGVDEFDKLEGEE